MDKCCKWALIVGCVSVLSLIVTVLFLQTKAWVHAVIGTGGRETKERLEKPMINKNGFDKSVALYLATLIANFDGEVTEPDVMLSVVVDKNCHVYTKTGDPSVKVVVFRGSPSLGDFIISLATHQDMFAPFKTLTAMMPQLDVLLAPLRVWDKKQGSAVSVKDMLPQGGSQVRVFNSFYKLYKPLRELLLSSIQGAKIILIGGHSVGGALANIFALDVSLNVASVQDLKVYTFGAPRVGNLEFKEALEQSPVLRGLYQIQNTCDIVPTLPYAVVPNNVKPSNPHFYSHTGKVVTYSANHKSFVANHDITNYMNALVSTPSVNEFSL